MEKIENKDIAVCATYSKKKRKRFQSTNTNGVEKSTLPSSLLGSIMLIDCLLKKIFYSSPKLRPSIKALLLSNLKRSCNIRQ